MNNNDKFDYTYSAPTENQRREIESIKKQYVAEPKVEGKLEQLRKLNKKVTQPPVIIAVITGILGTLIFGVGMVMVLEWDMMLWGIIIGVIGIAVAVAAYPIYKAILKRNKKIYGQQIIDLSNELLNGQDK